MRYVFMIWLVLVTGGCGVVTSQSLYEGVKAEQKRMKTNSDSNASGLPSYEQYQQERKKAQENQ